LGCGTNNFQIAPNETSLLYKLSIQYKTSARHVPLYGIPYSGTLSLGGFTRRLAGREFLVRTHAVGHLINKKK
jgi:hypothetical protein